MFLMSAALILVVGMATFLVLVVIGSLFMFESTFRVDRQEVSLNYAKYPLNQNKVELRMGVEMLPEPQVGPRRSREPFPPGLYIPARMFRLMVDLVRAGRESIYGLAFAWPE